MGRYGVRTGTPRVKRGRTVRDLWGRGLLLTPSFMASPVLMCR
jgi:hypothetical protein